MIPLVIDPTCPVCGDEYHGGPQRYVDVYGNDAVACADEHACADAWVWRPEIRAAMAYLRRLTERT